MTYSEFIKRLQDALSEEGVRISQDKLKKIFETMSDVVIDNIGETDKIPLKEFIIFRLTEIPPKKLPNGEWTEKQLSLKIEMTEKYKKKIKDKLNK